MHSPGQSGASQQYNRLATLPVNSPFSHSPFSQSTTTVLKGLLSFYFQIKASHVTKTSPNCNFFVTKFCCFNDMIKIFFLFRLLKFFRTNNFSKKIFFLFNFFLSHDSIKLILWSKINYYAKLFYLTVLINKKIHLTFSLMLYFSAKILNNVITTIIVDWLNNFWAQHIDPKKNLFWRKLKISELSQTFFANNSWILGGRSLKFAFSFWPERIWHPACIGARRPVAWYNYCPAVVRVWFLFFWWHKSL